MSLTETNIKKNCSHFIKIYYKILKEFEKYPNKKWIRRFSLLPTKNDYLMSNIEIDDTCLTEETNERNRRFSNTIYTDGVSVSVRIAKPKVIEYEDGTNFQQTTRDYRHKCKMNYNRQKREKWYKEWVYYSQDNFNYKYGTLL